MTTRSADERERLIHALREARRRLARVERGPDQPVAVIGAALRFPGCRSLAEYWAATLSGGEGCIRDLSDRWDTGTYFDPRPATPGKLYTLAGGRVDDLDLFDARYFGITPKEACIMDPQHRMLLELGLAALEDSRIDWAALPGSDTGVYVGMGSMDYALLVNDLELVDTRFATGNALSGACGRISYTFGLQGPSVTVDTACSASLTALHLGVQAVRSGECRMALIAGANALLSPIPSIALCSGGLLAADGRARVFDNDAHGLVRAEGGSVVILKSLQDAIDDGNPVLSVIRGSAMCHDGASSGMTVPNGSSQRKVIGRALRNAGVTPASVGYIEAHGASTRLGDPIELGSLDSEYGDRAAPLYVGSTKAVMGHLEAGAGLAGFLRATLVVREGVIPPQANFETPNANFGWNSSALRVATEPERWPVEGQRLAGVSAFGISGTNVHVIVQEPPASEPVTPGDGGLCLLTLSAVDGEQLRHQAKVWADWTPEPGTPINAIAHSSNVTRATLPERLCVAGRSFGECRAVLDSFARGENPPRAVSGRVRTGLHPEVSWWFEDASALSDATARDLAESIQRYAPEHRALLAKLDEQEALAWLDGHLQWDRLGPSRRSAAVWLQTGIALVADRLGIPIQRYAGVGSGCLAAAACAGSIDTLEALRRIDGDSLGSPQRADLLAKPWQALVIVGDSSFDYDALPGKAIVCQGDSGLLLALGTLWVEFGLSPQWNVMQATTARASIPRTSLHRERYWVDMLGAAENKGLLGPVRRSRSHRPGETEFVTRLSVSAWPALADHVVDGARVFPAVGYVQLLLEAMASLLPDGPSGTGFIEDLRLLRPLIVPDGGVDLHLIARRAATEGETWSAELAAPNGEAWTVHATADIHARINPADADRACSDLAATRSRCQRELDVADGYRWLADNGVALGPGFRLLRTAWAGEAELIGQVGIDQPNWRFAPSTMDGCFHLLAPLCRERGLEGLHLPESIHRVEVFAPLRGAQIWVRAVIDEAGSESHFVRAGFELFDNEGGLVARITGLALRRRGAADRPAPVPILGVDWVPYDWRSDSVVSQVNRRFVDPADRTVSVEDLMDAWQAEQLVLRLRPEDRPDSVEDVLALCRRVAKVATHTTRAPLLVFVTRGGSDSPPVASAAASAAFLRSFALENPGLGVVLVDEAGDADPALTERLLDELTRDVGERQFATRPDGVYVPRLVHRSVEPAEVELSADRWYVVAGGTRGVGLEIALSMEDLGARRIAVCGRAADADDERVEHARIRGVDFRAAAVDVTDAVAVDAWLAALRADAPIGGVVHAAGVVKDALVPSIDLRDCADVWDSKVVGARNLLTALSGDDPAFVVFFSSAAAVFGSPAQALYAAANGHLEATATTVPCRVHTIAWGPWDDIGIAAALPPAHRRLLESRGFRFIRRAEGVNAFWRIVAGHPGHSVAASINRQLLGQAYAASGYEAFLHQLDPPPRTPAPAAQAVTASADIDLIEYLTRQVAFVSGSPAGQLSPDDDLFDLGLDSLMMLDVIDRVNRDFRIHVAPDDIFDNATIAKLSAHLRKLVAAENGTVDA